MASVESRDVRVCQLGTLRELLRQPLDDGISVSLEHPDQQAQLENKLPAYTVGSLTAKVKVEGLLAAFEQIIMSEAPVERFKEFTKSLEENVITLNLSSKHMVNRKFEKFGPAPSLKQRYAI